MAADYWERAALEREAAAQIAAEEQLRDMLILYNHALEDIEDEISKVKYNYKKRFGITGEQAEVHIGRNLRKYPMERLITELLTAGSDEERAGILKYIRRDGLSSRAYASRIERYDDLMNNIIFRMIELERGVRKAGEALRKSIYRNNYYSLIDDTAKGVNAGVSFSLIDEKALDFVMSKPWHGKRFSQRVWDNTERLAEQTQEIVGRYIISGRSLDKAAEEIEAAFEIEKFHAATLIRTEVAQARAVSDLQGYEDMGVETYKYIATLDERTCDTCGPLDGQVFPIAAAVSGVNYPTMHPRCRCTTSIDFDGALRRARNPISGRNELIDGGMDYNSWRANMTEEEKAAFDVKQKKYRNKAADKKQHETFREVLGKNVPRSLDKFQDLKYNEGSEWVKLKISYDDKLLQKEIRETYNLKIHEGRQGKHILGHNNYIEGRSYLNVSMEEAQELVNKYAGTGTIDRAKGTLKWKGTETIVADKIIGVNINNRTGEQEYTNTFKIHYSKKGTHIVPKHEEGTE